MAQRLLVGLGAAALITAAAGALAPAAFAKDLAEGVSCSEHSCRNDTDDIYRIQARVLCSGFDGAHEISVWVNSHSTEEVQAGCTGRWVSGGMRPGTPSMNSDGTWSTPPMVTEPDTYEPSYLRGIEYLSAVVDNSGRARPAPAPSGS
ncbi:hypothetical protein [Nocardia aurantiaca]|uniref:Uncharacterized protein n=1 Tax=Nocardia aurantiaca TaxID=2675850 RepID=A0A6I3L453_9NOCA|nr:hypothetical protein [Nocardia aurantiaca]MTE17122.1 hypothetical protein [Nocardia aurantiaca]